MNAPNYTPFPELNAVLAHLLDGVRQALGTNLVGVYLQGSFGIGGFSEHSDCDFIVVTENDLSAVELDALQALHKRIHTLPYAYWRTGLEGSYAPRAVLRRWSEEPRDPPDEPRTDDWRDPGTLGTPPLVYPFWYLDHGADTLVRSEHDNTQVVRWTLRERGITLLGPEPESLIDPIAPDALKADAFRALTRYLPTGLYMPIVAWQAFWVSLFCRILHTLTHAEVVSKHEAMAWARQTLDPQWDALIGRAQTMRKGDDTQAAQPATIDDVAATHAFAAYTWEQAKVLFVEAPSR